MTEWYTSDQRQEEKVAEQLAELEKLDQPTVAVILVQQELISLTRLEAPQGSKFLQKASIDRENDKLYRHHNPAAKLLEDYSLADAIAFRSATNEGIHLPASRTKPDRRPESLNIADFKTSSLRSDKPTQAYRVQRHSEFQI
ncbi:unnamed protein product [Caenorhabditis auriculariae]|uniref:Uncharacterized protein n=1 Tax=Caenorhabditis auriculariae TaxID=2777116 RepID=A0A8S1I0S0_9PELO|nr:unnamed protein product [Caenorhabditis auriculariae]